MLEGEVVLFFSTRFAYQTLILLDLSLKWWPEQPAQIQSVIYILSNGGLA